MKRLRFFSHHDALTSLASLSTSDCFTLLFAVASRYLLGINGQVPIWGMDVDSMIMYGLVCGGASAINEATKDFTLPLLGLDKSIASTAQMIAAPALTGAAVVGVSYFINGMKLPDSKGVVNGFLLGAGADIGGSYVANMIE